MKTKLVRLSKSIVGELEASRVSKVISEDGYLGMGKEVQIFEQRLSSYLGRECLAVNSGTAALHLALEAIIENGDEVLIPTITYVASYQAVIAAGGIPVSVDVNASDLSIDLNDAALKLTPKTKVIMPVLYAGSAKSIVKVECFAQKHCLRVVQDAAHAFGSKDRGRLVGSIGDIVCFSFDGIKNITCGEGGAVVTSDEQVLEYCKTSRLLGVKNDTEARFKGRRSWSFDVTTYGYRYHMSNLNAAIGNVQLDRFSEFVESRQALAKHYCSNLKSRNYAELLDIDYSNTVPHIFCILLSEQIDRDALRVFLRQRSIETGVHYVPNHRHAFFNQSLYPCETADMLYPRLLSLPLHPEVNFSDADYIVESIDEFVGSKV